VSQGELDVVRRWVEAWNDGATDTFHDFFDADAEVITDPAWMEAGPFRGRTAVMGWFQGLQESWDSDKVVLTESFERGGQVVARVDWQVRGRTSGIETSLDATSVNAISNGKIVRQQWYFDHAEALKAVGLEE
jgi:ketosteroid isomerase-like protein